MTELAPDLERCRISLRELLDELRPLSGEELARFRVRDVPLELTHADLSAIAAVRVDGSVASPWQAAVADSVALGVLWGELTEERIPTLEDDPEELDVLLDRFQLLTIDVHTEIEGAANLLGTVGPKITAALEQAGRRVDGIAERVRRRRAGEPEVDAPAPDPEVEAEPGANGAPRKPIPFELEMFLAPSFERLRAVLAQTGVHATHLGVTAGSEERLLTPAEAGALDRCRASLTDENASARDRLLSTIATFTFWLGSQTRTLVLPPAARPPADTEEPTDRDTARDALAALERLADDIREIARNRGELDLVQALTPTAGRLGELGALCDILAPRRASSPRLALRPALSPADFEARADGGAEGDGGGADGSKRREPRRRARRARSERELPDLRKLSRRQLRALALGLASVVLIGGAIANMVRVVEREQRPILAQPLAREDLIEVFPSAVLPTAAFGSDEARIGVGPEWRSWDAEERLRRIGRACVLLGNRAWRSAVFLGPDGRPVARWSAGEVVMLDHSAPTPSAR